MRRSCPVRVTDLSAKIGAALLMIALPTKHVSFSLSLSHVLPDIDLSTLYKLDTSLFVECLLKVNRRSNVTPSIFVFLTMDGAVVDDNV